MSPTINQAQPDAVTAFPIHIPDADLSDLDVWHKDGVAGFVLIGRHGERQLVEISEHTFEMQLAEAEAFVKASREAA